MEKEQRFKVGDSVTYLSMAESAALKLRDDSYKKYRYGGEDRGGIIGQVLKYHEYNEEAKCWKIEVSRDGESWSNSYNMLECEFKEYLNTSSPEQYQIYFGNDVIGKSLPDGAVVSVTYLVTNGTSANKAKWAP